MPPLGIALCPGPSPSSTKHNAPSVTAHVAIRDAALTAIDASAHPVAATYLAMTELGTPDTDITLAVDVEEHLGTR